MERILAIYIEDGEYAAALASYLNGRRDFLFRTAVFTSAEALMSFAEHDHIDMLLGDPRLVCDGASLPCADRVCVLGESLEDDSMGFPAVYRYMSAERIMRDITAVYTGQGISGDASCRAGGADVISVCTPVGGSFASTFALALAARLSAQGRTLFLGFDPFFVLPGDLRRNSDRNMTDILYYLETYGSDPAGLLAKVARRYGELDLICGVSHWADVADVSAEHMMRLLCAASGGGYEHIVFDTSLVGRGSEVILGASGTVFVPVRPEGRSRTEEWKRQLTFTGRGAILAAIHELEVPYDAGLAGDFAAEALLSGELGHFIEGPEVMGYIKQRA